MRSAERTLAQPWVLRLADIAVQSCDALSLFQEQSLPVHIACKEEGWPLQLFDAAAVVSETTKETPPSLVAPEGPAMNNEKQRTAKRKRLQEPQQSAAATEQQHAVDCVFYAGGTVWAMDWCPFCPDAYSRPAPDQEAQPSQPTPGSQLAGAHDLLAVAAHHKSHSRNKAGKVLTGTGAIQLWHVPFNSSSIESSAPLPKLEALLLHEGKLTWDIKWCPNPTHFLSTSSSSSSTSKSSQETSDHNHQAGAPEGQQQHQQHASAGSEKSFEELALWSQEAAEDSVPVQGLLAAILGNGDVCIYAVPALSHLHKLQQQQPLPAPTAAAAAGGATEGQEASSSTTPGVRLEPLVRLQYQEHMLGSMGACCEWFPSAPHDKLLVGCSDGKVHVWKLPLSPADVPQKLLVMVAAGSAIRSVAWRPAYPTVPPRPAGSSIDSSSSRGGAKNSPWEPMWFATGSHAGDLCVWDSSSCMQPTLRRGIGAGVGVNAVVWSSRPESLIWGLDGGEVRQLVLDMEIMASMVACDKPTPAFVHAGDNAQCIWSIDECPDVPVLAYAGDAGVLGAFATDCMTSDGRVKAGHAGLGAIVAVDGDVWVLRPDQIEGNGGLQLGGRASRPTKSVGQLSHALQVLYSVRFSRNQWGWSLLASGGAAGIVRVQRIGFQGPHIEARKKVDSFAASL